MKQNPEYILFLYITLSEKLYRYTEKRDLIHLTLITTLS